MTKEMGEIPAGLGPEEVVPTRRTLLDLRMEWEQKRVARIDAGEAKPVLIERVTPEYQKIRELPSLSGTNIKLHPEGYLFVPIRMPKETVFIPEKKKAVLVNPEGLEYKVILPKRTPKDYLNNLPEGRPVYEWVYLKLDNIKDGISQQRKILKKIYGVELSEGEMGFARRVIEHTEAAIQDVMSEGKITKRGVRQIVRNTAKFLEEVGLYDPRDPKKRRVLDKFSDILPLGKKKAPLPNYLILLSKIGSAHSAMIERLAVLRFHARKFEINLQMLLMEDQNSLFRFRLADSQLEQVLRHYAFKRPERATPLQQRVMTDVLGAIARRTLAEIKVRPYLFAARWLAINLVGCREDKKEENLRILGDKVAEGLFEQKPVTQLIEEGEFAEAERRINTLRRGIKKVLKRNEEAEKT